MASYDQQSTAISEISSPDEVRVMLFVNGRSVHVPLSALLENLSEIYQPLDPQLTAIAGLTGANGRFIRWTGADTAVMQAMVGTVSQSGGIPTGAIIERGSNANGEYVRFADGTQLCWLTSLTLTFSAATVLSGTWTFPAVFSVAPVVTGISHTYSMTPQTTQLGAMRLASFGTSSAGIIQPRVNGQTDFVAGNTMGIAVAAEGRWF